MFSNRKITTSTKEYLDNINRTKELLQNAEAVIIGAGAGLSTSAGFTYTGKRFEDNFSDFTQKYGFRDMYSGGFYPFESLEEHWAYWSRYIFINRLQPMLTTNSRKQGLISTDCFIRRVITVCFNAASLAIMPPMITRQLSVIW